MEVGEEDVAIGEVDTEARQPPTISSELCMALIRFVGTVDGCVFGRLVRWNVQEEDFLAYDTAMVKLLNPDRVAFGDHTTWYSKKTNQCSSGAALHADRNVISHCDLYL